jgi:polar amino acid transport system permease protein
MRALDWSILWQYRAALVSGLLTTLWVSAAGIACSTVVGVLVGCLGALPASIARRLASTYTGFMRNLPMIVKLFFLYFVLGLPAVPAAILALTLHQSAYIADVMGAGLRSVARGQVDAALSLGLKWMQAFRCVVLPQVLRIVMPPLTTQYVAVIKNSSVVAFIAIPDLTYQTQDINVETFRGFEAATAATALYGLISLTVIGCMSALASRLGTR